MTCDERTWIVMLRDVSRAVPVRGQPVVMLSLVLDMGTGLALGNAAASTSSEALAQGLQTATTKWVGPLAPGRPERVLCRPDLVTQVERELARMEAGGPAPAVTGVGPVAEAEDIFDSLIGHMGGQSQPDELPAPGDWQLLFHHGLCYCQEAPWERWSDIAHLALTVSVAGEPTTYLAVVIGAEGVQRGLVLYPGTALPRGLGQWEPGRPVPVPAGTLMFFLDPPSELEAPPEFVAKALRYGWPVDAGVVPVWVGKGPDGPSDLSRHDVQRLILALAAVVTHDRRGPVVVGAGSDTTSGELALNGGRRASFSIRLSPAPGD